MTSSASMSVLLPGVSGALLVTAHPHRSATRLMIRALMRFTFAAALFSSVTVACAQTPSRPIMHAEGTGQLWPTNYYGKTLSSLGEIVSLRIDRRPSSGGVNTNWTHRLLWEIIEQSEVRDLASMGVAVGLPPTFSIEYASGLRVRADRFTAVLNLPDGREGAVILAPRPNPHGGADGKRPLGSGTNQTPASAGSGR